MTREEAIKYIDGLHVVPCEQLEEFCAERNTAIDMAIKALQRQTGGDLISRADAIKAICNAQCELDVPHYPQCDQVKYCDEIKALLALPSAVAVSREEYEEVKEEYINTVGAVLAVISAPSCLKEVNDLIEPLKVVWCKDCRHRDLFSCPLADNDFQKDDDFCSWGERREP